MTMPHLMNCPHSHEGWCADCVANEYRDNVWHSHEHDAAVQVRYHNHVGYEVWLHSDTYTSMEDAVAHARRISEGYPLDMLLQWCRDLSHSPPWIRDAAEKLSGNMPNRQG